MRAGALVLGLALAATAAAAQDSSGAAAPAATIHAGLDGYYTVGRWTPIRVDAETRGADFAGEVAVEWGAATYRQALTLPSPSRKRVELYVRAADLRDSLRVALHDVNGRVVLARDVPVRGILPAEPLHVVVDPPTGGLERVHAAFVAAADLPGSWRGYDGVDEVRIGAAAALLQPPQSRALERWLAVRGIDDASELRRDLPRAAAGGAVDRGRWQFVATYCGVLLLVAGVLPRLVKRTAYTHVALAAAAIAFAAVPVTLGLAPQDSGPASTARARATDAGAFVSTLAFARPARRQIAVVESPVPDALLEAAAGAPPHEIRYAEDGTATFAIAGSAGEVFSVVVRGFPEEAP